jgi:hypothetical protein
MKVADLDLLLNAMERLYVSVGVEAKADLVRKFRSKLRNVSKEDVGKLTDAIRNMPKR